MSAETTATGWLRAGTIGRPHGLDGSVHITRPNPQLRLSEGMEVRVGDRLVAIERRAGADTRVIVRLAGCGDRTAAEALRGREILVARAQAPALGPDEWWAEDLEGCAVSDAGRAVGTVRRLLALPSCEVLEVEPIRGGRELLVPLIGEAVRSVDVKRREIDISLDFLGEP